VRDDLRCLSCCQWADFDLTAEAHMQMMAALLVRSARPEPNPDSNGDAGPFQLIDVTYRWQKRPAPVIIGPTPAMRSRWTLLFVQMHIAGFDRPDPRSTAVHCL
jgi:hypothetical protein